jgi:hypothetical protein
MPAPTKSPHFHRKDQRIKKRVGQRSQRGTRSIGETPYFPRPMAFQSMALPLWGVTSAGVRPLKWMKENGGATALPREKAGAAKRRGSRPNREAGRTGPIGKWRLSLFVIGHKAGNGLGFRSWSPDLLPKETSFG